MIRVAMVAVALALVGCYTPPREPEPDRLQIEALLPTPLLAPARAACTARLLREEAAAAVPRQRLVDRMDYAGFPRMVPHERPDWATPEYQASYDAAEDAARALTRSRAARSAGARVLALEQSGVDYAELTLAHERAFAAAALEHEGARRSAEKTLRAMALSQPDLEALYQEQFRARYRGEQCSGATAIPHLAQANPGRMPLLPTPLLDPARATCVAASLAARAASQWRLVYAHEIGDSAAPALPTGPVPGTAWTDWRAARAFADLAALHADAFALGVAPGEDKPRQQGEARLRRAARAHPELEALYQRAFDPAYRAGACPRPGD